jgi:hypothetical protein
MNQRMGRRTLIELDRLLDGPPNQIGLLEWARHVITQASSCGVYGMQHPFLDPEVDKAFWYYESLLSLSSCSTTHNISRRH